MSMKNPILQKKKKKGNFVEKLSSAGHNYISPWGKGAVGGLLGITPALGRKAASLQAEVCMAF